MLLKTFSCHHSTWPHGPLPVLRSCKKCVEHRQWSPCHDLSTDWVKEQQMACRLFRRVAPSSSQFGLRRLLQARPLMMTVLRATTNCPTDELLLDPTVQTNSTKCVLQCILIYVSGLKAFELFLFIHSSPHMLNNSYCNKPSSLWRSGMNLFILLVKKGPALYLTSIILPVFQVFTCTA